MPPRSAARQADLEDWCRELSNQHAGRFKNKLLTHGCEVRTGLPALVTGSDLAIIAPPDADVRNFYFSSRHGNLTLTLAMLIAPEFELGADTRPSTYADVMSEGAISLF